MFRELEIGAASPPRDRSASADLAANVNSLTNFPLFLSVEQFAIQTQVKPATVRELCRRGEIPGARKLGSYWRIPRSLLESWLGGGQS